MGKDNIIRLSDYNNLSTSWSVLDMLDHAKKVVEEEPQYKKALLILLDEDGRYETRPLCAGIGKTSELIALLDIEKSRQQKEIDP